MTSMTSYYIGVDIGTTSTKAVVFGKKSEPVTASYFSYSLHSPTAHISEQNPNEIFFAVKNSIKQAVKNCLDSGTIRDNSQIALIAFSCAMHSILAVDSAGDPLTNSITWADRRAYNWALNVPNKQEIYQRTGAFVNAASPFCKLLWLKSEYPKIFEQAHKFISIKEYVFYRLFGEYVVDYSIAGASGLFNMSTLNWDTEVLKIIGITPDKLSKIVPTTTIMGKITANNAQDMGINANTPVVIGANDGTLSNLGVNAISSDVVAVTIGTSAAIRTVLPQPFTGPPVGRAGPPAERVGSKARTFCYPLTTEHWVIGGALNGAGVALRWFCDNFCELEQQAAATSGDPLDVYKILAEKAEKVAVGADGLLFHPSLPGERNPLKAVNMRGSFWGLGLHHTKSHMIRAILEGVIFNLCTILPVIEEIIDQSQTTKIAQIKATGGFARSFLWRQIMADILGKKIIVPQSFESSCLGAVVLGQYATGEITTITAVANMIGTTHQHTPIPENFAKYQKILPVYLRLYEVFLEEYSKIDF
ncbi:MAG: FGGY family carbohydrate kinase [Defluviitaleaceae bacterium]|nr:FGGY family carbohydrate kinase [Defluviitaleaceae bacterium]